MDASRDHKIHTRQILSALRLFLLRDLHLGEQLLKDLSVLFIRKILYIGPGNDVPHPGDLRQLIRRRVHHLLGIISQGTADHLCIGDPDIGDPQTVYQPRQRCHPGILYACLEVQIGLLSESVHRLDLIRIPVKMENIGKIFDKSVHDEFLQRRLGQSFDIHRIPAHKKCKRLDMLCLTPGICADQRLRLIFHIDPCLTAADRTDLRNIPDAAPGQVLRDLRNDHVGLVHLDPVPHTQLQFFHDTDVVDAGAAHGSSLQLYRFEYSDRIDQPCP